MDIAAEESGEIGGDDLVLPEDFVPKWLAKVQGATREEDDWRKEGKKICNVYTPKNTKKASYYNTLYSNVDVLLPVLYSSTPKADVRRRVGATNAVAKFSSQVIERVIEYQLSEYDFDYVVQLAVLDALLPGRGLLKVSHTPVISKKTDAYGNAHEEMTGEYAECEYIKWEDFRRSYGRVWNDVTWIAFRNYATEEDAEAQFGKDIADKLSYNVVANENEGNEKEKQYAQSNRAVIWEIWDKVSGNIIYIAESYKDAPLATPAPPPTKFHDFWPIPRPLQFIIRSDSLVPYPEYQEYREQAELLAEISTRIARITRALKVRGVYDSTMAELQRLFDAGDNDMLPAENVAAMYEKGGIDKMVWMLPIQDLAAALNYLYQQREQTKAVIFEISGVSDILRGESKASETLGAQQIKVQYANTRLKRRQKEIQRFIRDIFRLKAEIIAENFSPDTLAKIANISPQELQAANVQPQEILDVLHNGDMRDYMIDVESDSMVALEDQDAQQQISTFLQAINQFFAMIGPLVQSGVMPIEVAKSILVQVAHKFKLGDEFENALEQLQPPTPPQPKPEALAAKQNADTNAKLADAKIADNQQRNEINMVKTTHDVVQSGVEAHHQTAERNMPEENKNLTSGQN